MGTLGFKKTPSTGGVLSGSNSLLPRRPYNTRARTHLHMCAHTCTYTIDFSPLGAEQELNYLQVRTAVSWSHAQVGKRGKGLYKKT